MFFNNVLRWFVIVWIGLVLLANLAGITGMFMTAETVWAGLGKVREIYSPFNLVNYAVEVVCLLPAIGAQLWLGKRRKKMSAIQ
jgi:hypothetical protein